MQYNAFNGAPRFILYPALYYISMVFFLLLFVSPQCHLCWNEIYVASISLAQCSEYFDVLDFWL